MSRARRLWDHAADGLYMLGMLALVIIRHPDTRPR